MKHKAVLRPATPFAMMLALGACASSGPKKPSNVCDAVETVSDPFEGQEQQTTTYLDSVGGSAKRRISVINKKSGPVLEIWLNLPGQRHEVLEAGAPAEFVLGDQIATVGLHHEARPVVDAAGYSFYTQWHLQYELTPAMRERMKQVPMTAARVHLGAEYVTSKLPAWGGKRLMDGARCMFDPPTPAPVVPEGLGGVTAQ